MPVFVDQILADEVHQKYDDKKQQRDNDEVH
jgi:hypothetical protein